jgi:hypothetical protein
LSIKREINKRHRGTKAQSDRMTKKCKGFLSTENATVLFFLSGFKTLCLCTLKGINASVPDDMIIVSGSRVAPSKGG